MFNCTVYCILYTVYCILYTVYGMLYAVYCILYTVCCMRYAVCCMLYAVCCMLYAVYCILYTVYCILNAVYCMLYTVWCILYACMLECNRPCTAHCSEKLWLYVRHRTRISVCHVEWCMPCTKYRRADWYLHSTAGHATCTAIKKELKRKVPKRTKTELHIHIIIFTKAIFVVNSLALCASVFFWPTTKKLWMNKVRCIRCNQPHGTQLSVGYTLVVLHIRVHCIRWILCGIPIAECPCPEERTLYASACCIHDNVMPNFTAYPESSSLSKNIQPGCLGDCK